MVENIEAHLNWKLFLDLTRRVGLEACWSEPIHSLTGKVLGTFAIYDTRLRAPEAEELQLLEDAAHFVGLALERRQAEQALQENEKRYHTLFDSASDAILIHDLQGKFLEVNQVAVDRLGYDREALLAMRLTDLDTWPAAEHIPENLARLAQTGQSIFESAHVCQDGRIMPVEVNSTLIDYNGHPAIFSIARNITERKHTEAQIRKLSSALEQSPAVVIITNHEGQIEYANPTFVEHSGFSVEEALGQNPRILKSSFHPPEFHKDLWKTIVSGKVWRGEFCNQHKSGELYWESASIAPLRDETGTITHFVAVKEDITEHKRLEEELQKAYQAAQAANLAKSIFLANMSHEIRTPMNAILGFSQLMLNDPSMSAQHQAHLRTVMRSGEHLLNLINDILEISKIEAGRTEFIPIAFDLHALLQDMEEMFRQRVESKYLQFLVEIEHHVPRFVITDDVKLRQIFINLLSNAVKFTRQGSVSWRVLVQPSMGENLRLVAEITDSGPGISAEEMGRIFKPFQQGAAGNRSIGGTGLGLAISHQFALLMGGDITVTSAVGQGSCFRLEVGVQKCDGITAPDKPQRRVVGLVPGQAVCRVLVVDDHLENRLLMSEQLKAVGFEIQEAVNGLDAVAKFQTWQPQIVLMDMRMPVMDGYEAIKRIKATPQGALTMIIAVTASAFQEDRQIILQTGADAYLRKPYKEEELFDLIHAAGIQYIYAVQPQIDANEVNPVQLTVAMLENIPPALIEPMLQATLSANLDQLLELIDQLGRLSPPIAGQLRDLANNFQYDALSNLFEGLNDLKKLTYE